MSQRDKNSKCEKDDDQNKRKNKTNQIDNDDDPKTPKKQSSVFNSDDDTDPNTRKQNNKPSLLDSNINYQIELLNQAQTKYTVLAKINVSSRNIILFAVDKPTNDEYRKSNCFAIKLYPYHTDSEKEKVDNELKIIYELSSYSSIIKYLDKFQNMFLNSFHMFIVMHYYEKLDLMEAAHDFRDKRFEFVSFPEEEICQIAIQALNILKLLKSKKIVHNNIRLENFLVKVRKPITIVLTGFEFAEFIDNKLSQNSEGCIYTHAPEVLEHKPHNTSADIWSLGVVLYQLLAETYPFDLIPKADNEEDILDKIINGELQQYDIPDIPYQLIKQMLEIDPEKRITVEDALNSDWLRGIKMIIEDTPDMIIDMKEKMSIYEESLKNGDIYD